MSSESPKILISIPLFLENSGINLILEVKRRIYNKCFVENGRAGIFLRELI